MKPSHESTRSRVERTLEKVTNVMSIALISPAAVALVAWVVVMTVFIAARALFNVGWMFVEEFTAYLVVLVSFFALPYTLISQGHIRVDVITKKLPRRVRGILEVVTTLLSLVVVGYLAHKGVLWFWYGVEVGRRSEFPSNLLMWPVYLFVPIGLAALEWALLVQLYRSVIGLVEGGRKR